MAIGLGLEGGRGPDLLLLGAFLGVPDMVIGLGLEGEERGPDLTAFWLFPIW